MNDITSHRQRGPSFLNVLRAMRPRQWLKNVLIFVPMAAGHRFESSTWLAALIMFFIFCCCASSAYLLNDVLDLEHDRQHPQKRARPIAAGLVSVRCALLVSTILILTGMWLASLRQGGVLLVVLLYFVLTVIYSVKLKQMVLIDVTVLAVLYTIRVLAGGIATGIELSFWLLSFSFFVFLSLALLKRHNELLRSKKLADSLVPGRGYVPNDSLPIAIFGICCGMIAALILLLYYNSGVFASLYPQPLLLIGVLPLFFIWIGRLWLLSFRGAIHEDPLLHVSTDVPSLLIIGACLLLGILASK